MKKYYHVITEENDEYISTVAHAESVEAVKAHFAGQNVREIIELNAAQANTISAAAATTIIDLAAEQPQTVTHDYTALADTIRTELNARHDRSAWGKAVTLYAFDLLDDVQEGADILMIKPAMPYLDLVRACRDRFDLPVAAYQVSGEYAMIKAAAKAGLIDEYGVMCESAVSIFRAGADILITYFACELADAIRKGDIG